MKQNSFDIIIVGAGHAGIEASLATARLGLKTLLLTMNIDNIALMPCNPSIGGSAKGHLVREIDALGGQMAICTDRNLLQIRQLNTKKGPAVRCLRAQCDKNTYKMDMKRTLENQENLFLRQGLVAGLLIKNNILQGVYCLSGEEYQSKAVIITAGTSFNGICHIGDCTIAASRLGEPPSQHLSAHLQQLGFQKGRLKTGTPPRILGKTIDFSNLEMEKGCEEPLPFSYLSSKPSYLKKIPCYILHTSPETKRIIQENIHLSPMFSGKISGIGARYCPSIEDKFYRFSDKETHLLFLEPETKDATEWYLQGFSSSMPMEMQIKMVHSLPGLEQAHILRPAYAIEYDFFHPEQLKTSLETKSIENLYFAGQINGSSGYEEAAGQGLVAGINAHLKLNNKKPLAIGRHNSYIGVLIDDLVTKGVREPYRMFSSLVEYRTCIRHDNADLRLTELGFQVGLASKERYQKMQQKRQNIQEISEKLQNTSLKNIHNSKKLIELLRMPEFTLAKLAEQHLPLANFLQKFNQEDQLEAEVSIKYEGYIKKQHTALERLKSLYNITIPTNFDYESIIGLSNEGRQKLLKIRPNTVAQAAEIPGLRTSDLSLLVVKIKLKNQEFS